MERTALKSCLGGADVFPLLSNGFSKSFVEHHGTSQLHDTRLELSLNGSTGRKNCLVSFETNKLMVHPVTIQDFFELSSPFQMVVRGSLQNGQINFLVIHFVSELISVNQRTPGVVDLFICVCLWYTYVGEMHISS